MWTMEDVLSELSDDQGEGNSYNNNSKKGRNNNNNNNGLPPGFRFHPTDEELITFYLASKVFHSHNLSPPVHIAEVDLNRCEPWDLPERAKMGEKEWYLYSLRDRKYPTGLRTNRATSTGYWKATGKDRQIHSSGSMGSNNTTGGTGHHGSSSSSGMLIGMKKTLVFYQGRAPRGVKTRWVMHEYRLDGHFSSFRLSSRDEWVICRIFMKNNGGEKRTGFYPLAPPPESPLSPFLRHLPPLLDVPVTATASSTSSTTKAPPLNSSTTKSEHQFPIHHHNDSNFLLQSLLSNPLPNFSSLTDEPNPLMFNTYHSAAAAAATSIDHLKSFCNPLPYPKHLPTTTVTAAGVNVQKQNRNLEQYYQNCMGRISQSSKQSNYDQFSVHDDGDYDDGEEEEEDEQDDNDDPSTVGFDMSTSVAALNRLLNPHHFNNFPAESWHLALID